MLILKLFKNQKEVGEIKFKDEEKFLMACNFAQGWRNKGQKDHCFIISFDDKKHVRACPIFILQSWENSG